MSATARTYQPAVPIWCAGCGHYGVLAALRSALTALEVPAHETLVVAGIGCSGTIQNYLGAYGYHALHGRVLPAATGVALSNPDLTVIGAGGDGDGYAIGAGHLVHAFRRNPSLAYLVMNNQAYGLTKGQPGPTLAVGRPSHVEGALDAALLGLAIPASTFVARGYSGWPEQLATLTRAALEHARAGSGFAFLEVISPCVTYRDTYPDWPAVLVDVAAEGGYDASDRAVALATTQRLSAEGRIACGLLFRSAGAPSAERPAPAYEQLDGAGLRRRYAAILDDYAVGSS